MTRNKRTIFNYITQGIAHSLWLGVFLYSIISLGFIVTELIGTPDISIIEMAQSGHKWALLATPFLLVVVLGLRRRRLAILLLPSLIALLVYYPPYLLPKVQAQVGDAPQLTVTTYNMLVPDRRMDEVANIIRDIDADVVAVQELGVEMADYLADALADDYPHQALHPQEGRYEYYRGQGIFSRYPIVEDEYWQYRDLPIIHREPATHGHQRVMLDFEGAEVVIYNTHMWPSVAWSNGWRIEPHPQIDEGHRVAVSRIMERVLAESHPLVLLGDFNMTDQYNEYDFITEYYTDSWRNIGNGLGFTYPTTLPFPIVRLDYVFHSAHWESIHAQVWDESGPSDHLPLRVTLALMDDGS